MKIVIFSDTHLNTVFDKKKFNFLKKTINSADQVIINGDFWEGFDMTFTDFIKSPWKGLFPYLLKKKTVYIYGNHDLKRLSNEKTKLFSVVQTEQYKLKLNGKTYLIEHGHRFLPLADKFFMKYLGFLPPWWMNQTYEKFEGLMIKIFGKKYLSTMYQVFNNEMKMKAKKYLKKNEFFIFGHSHLTEYDRENNFLNGGFIRHGIGQYILIDNGEIKLVDEWY